MLSKQQQQQPQQTTKKGDYEPLEDTAPLVIPTPSNVEGFNDFSNPLEKGVKKDNRRRRRKKKT